MPLHQGSRPWPASARKFSPPAARHNARMASARAAQPQCTGGPTQCASGPTQCASGPTQCASAPDRQCTVALAHMHSTKMSPPAARHTARVPSARVPHPSAPSPFCYAYRPKNCRLRRADAVHREEPPRRPNTQHEKAQCTDESGPDPQCTNPFALNCPVRKCPQPPFGSARERKEHVWRSPPWRV